MWVESVLNHLVPDEQKLDVSMRHDTDWLLQWMVIQDIPVRCKTKSECRSDNDRIEFAGWIISFGIFNML